jgi:hypothetical protein
MTSNYGRCEQPTDTKRTGARFGDPAAPMLRQAGMTRVLWCARDPR